MIEHDFPHVLKKFDGLTEVDKLTTFQSPSDAAQKILTWYLVGVGKCGMTFRYSEEGSLLARLDAYNTLGYAWTYQLLYELRLSRHQHKEDLDYLFSKMDWHYKSKYESCHSEKNARKILTERVAGHNSFFRRFPAIGIPINSILYCQDQPLMVVMKEIIGTPLDKTPHPVTIPEEIWDFLGDLNPRNVFVCNENTTNGIAIIDISKFLPSNKNLHGNTRNTT